MPVLAQLPSRSEEMKAEMVAGATMATTLDTCGDTARVSQHNAPAAH